MAGFEEPVPTYADVAVASVDKRTGETKSSFNPVWLKWFLGLQNETNAPTNLASGTTGVLGAGSGGTGVDISTYYTGSITLAKVTGGGANGSLTVVNGLITAATLPT